MPNIPPPNELTAILRRGQESKDFDYKAASKWDEKDKKACCEIVKDILAMANTQGGFIAIGVSEQPGGFVFTILWSLPGMRWWGLAGSRVFRAASMRAASWYSRSWVS